MKFWKKTAALATAAVMVLGLGACSKSDSSNTSDNDTKQEEPAGGEEDAASGEPLKIGVIQYTEHVALDSAYEGFVAALADGGYKDGENITIDFQNAQADQSNLKTISQRFVNNGEDLILAIATPAAQSMAAETTEIPILVTAVTDLVGASLIEDNEAPGTNVSGTSDLTPVALQFDLLQEILPEAKTVGIMYTSSEVNSEIQAKIAMEAAEERGLAYEVGTVTNINDVAQAVASLADRVDVIYIPTDNVLANGMANVAALTNEAGVPVIVGEAGMCQNGGLATVGIDYYKLGYQTGQMAIRIFEGADISAMPVEYASDAAVGVNETTAKALGIEIPQSVMDRAVDVYTD